MTHHSHCEGSMYIYNSAVATTINLVDEYHAVQEFLEGSFQDGVTFLASANGAITDTADNGGVLRCTDGTHGLTTGQYITLNGMGDTAHAGRTAVTVIDVNTFDCDDITYNSASDTGFWQRGTCLTIDAGHGGKFSISFSISFLSAANNKNFKIELSKNELALDEFVAERKVAIQNDLGSAGSSGLVALEDGDCVYLTVEGTTDATNMTIKHSNVHLNRI